MSSSLAKGTLYFMLVQAFFMASGYIIHAGLGRLLGPEAYGIFGVVIYLITLVSVLLISGVPQAGSRFIAIANESVSAIKKATNNLQIIFSMIVFVLYFLLSPIIAAILGDPDLSGYLRLSSFVIPLNALYYLYSGFLNGLRLYEKQAATLFIYSIGKILASLGLVLLGFAINGAILGYIFGTIAALVMGWYYLRSIVNGSNPGYFPVKKIIDFSWPIILFSFALLLLMSLDLFMVKRILGTDLMAGYYTAASTLSRAPYYILTGLGIALFPAISESTANNNIKQTGIYIKGSLRHLMLLIMPVVFIISGSSDALVSLFYSEKYISASHPLEILVFGLAAFTIFNILTTVINAAGKPRISMVITAILIPMALGLNLLLIPVYHLEGAAIATTFTGFFGLLIASAYTLKTFGVLMETSSIVKIISASMIVYVLTLAVQVNGILLPLWYLILFGTYLFILRILKELNKEDIETLKKILPSK